MHDQAGQASLETLASAFGRSLVGEVAPEELPFYDELLEAGKTPPEKHRDHPLAFGVEDIVSAAVSAGLFEIAKMVLAFAWENAKDGVGKSIKDLSAEGSALAIKSFSSWLTHGAGGQSPLRLGKKAIAGMMVAVEKEAKRQRLSEKDRKMLRYALERMFQAEAG